MRRANGSPTGRPAGCNEWEIIDTLDSTPASEREARDLQKTSQDEALDEKRVTPKPRERACSKRGRRAAWISEDAPHKKCGWDIQFLCN